MNSIKILTATCLLGCTWTVTLAFAHDSTDWRTDTRAFQSVRPDPQTKSNLDPTLFPEIDINPKWMQQKLTEFAGPGTLPRKSTEGRAAARAYLNAQYLKLGFETSEHSYGGGGINFIAKKAGRRDGKTLILSSHLDSVGNMGANDDGIGTIAALAVAQALAERNYKNTLVIVAFDQEELGLVGSKAFVSAITDPSQILGDIQLEMMGVNRRGDGAFHVIDCDRPDSVPFSNAIKSAIASMGLPLKRVAACTDRSDHASFWKRNIPAVVLSENFFGGDADPCYHRSCDVVDSRLNFEYAANITKAVASATAMILNSTHLTH